MAVIEIYTARYCPYSAAAKALLKRKGVGFKEIDIAANWEKRDEMIARAHGQSTIPQIFIDSVHVGGLQELQTLDRERKLDGLLHANSASPHRRPRS
jgi:glutaredoxin 3